MKRKPTEIINFTRDADFFLRLGDKNADRGDMPGAYNAYREALNRNPGDIDACLAAAEMLYQMHCYEESNRLLMIQQTMFTPVPEISFGLACNFYAINEFDYAEESLETYLTLDPDGPYAYDAEDFLDLIDDDDALAENLGIDDFEDFDTLTICKRAEHLINSGCSDLAVELIKEHLTMRPNAYRAMDTLTTAYFDLDKMDEAEKLNAKVRADYPESVNALLNYAIILQRQGDLNGCREQLGKALGAASESVEGLVSVAAMYTLLKQYEDAYPVLFDALGMFPYDVRGLYLMGHVCLVLKKDKDARGYYETLLKLDPLDIVAKSYYRKAVSGELTDATRRFIQPFTLPIAEVLEHITELHHLFVKGADAIREEWEKDDSILSLFRWGITMPNDQLKESIVVMLGLIGDCKAEYTLRDMLLRTDIKDELKRKIFVVLKSMKAREPFSAYLDSQWTQGTVNLVNVPKSVPPTYRAAMELLEKTIPKSADSQQLVIECLQRFSNFINDRSCKLGGLTASRQRAFAAMLEWEASAGIGIESNIEEIAARYNTTVKEMEKFKAALHK